jgi:hypothetical protein
MEVSENHCRLDKPLDDDDVYLIFVFLHICHPDIRVKHGSIWAFTSTAITPYTDVCVYKTERCGNTMFRKKVLHAICSVLLVWEFIYTFKSHLK